MYFNPFLWTYEFINRMYLKSGYYFSLVFFVANIDLDQMFYELVLTMLYICDYQNATC